MSESCRNPVTETGEVLMPKKPKSDMPRICVKCKNKYRELSYTPFGILQVCDLARLLTIFIIERKLVYRDCFTPLVSTKFRQALEPHINHAPTGPQRGALKPS
ncbi:hypothetical protein EDB92DRAFT_233846 [Lactarius akahatsu]|uniref:Uncharacterized protein n=1 Tax=Lactarius akahatsu TaxID=416441 RepID=A0AAD4LLD1_9AGAM|nr:hypothetical protein EDB92DRAFT_233846 [Lactarius akahatsu]